MPPTNATPPVCEKSARYRSSFVPSDTIFADPLLAPLADNGGLTPTHALLSGSPAIDAGDDGGWDTDQRGTGYPRVLNAHADIGAYEVDPDLIFRNGFD